jgi:hypothetical protein
MAHERRRTRLKFLRSARGADVLYRPSVQTPVQSVDAYVSILACAAESIEVRTLRLTYSPGAGELDILEPSDLVGERRGTREAIQLPVSQVVEAIASRRYWSE